MTAALFLALVLLVAAGLVAAAVRWGAPGMAGGFIASLLAWLGYVGLLGASGLLADPTLRPPAILALALPLAALMAWLVLSRHAARVALAVPIPVLIGAQTFRIGVELLLHRLWQDGLIPGMLTFDGANFDILAGLSAPLAALAATRGRNGRIVALVWNVAGLLLLGNVVGRAVMTAPGALNLIVAEVPNHLPGLFPYAYLPGFLAPLALALHVLAIRATRADRSAPRPEATRP